MDASQHSQTTRLIPLLVAGIISNTLGIVLLSFNKLGFVLIGLGLALMIAFIVKAVGARKI